MKFNYDIDPNGYLVKSENPIEYEKDVKDKSGTIKRINAQAKSGKYSRTTYSYMKKKRKDVPDNPLERVGVTQKEYRYDPEKQEVETEHTGASGSGKQGIKTTIPTTSKYEKELKMASQETDLEKSEGSTKETSEVTGAKRVKGSFVTQHASGTTVAAKYGKRKDKDTGLYSRFTRTTQDPETGNIRVESDKGTAEYPTHVNVRDYGTGKEKKVANVALPKKSFSSDDVTVARLLKGKSVEEAEQILEMLKDKAASVYTTPGALSSKASGGAAGVKLMGEIDKHKAGKPSELDPKKEESNKSEEVDLSKATEFGSSKIDPKYTTPGALASKTNVMTPEERAENVLTRRKVNPKGLEGLKRMSGSTMKSIMDVCDDIMEKAMKAEDIASGKKTKPKERSLVEGPYAAEAKHKFERRTPAREAHQAKQKEAREATGRAVAHFRSKADEGFGEESSESEEKSYSLDFNKSILERMGLEKGRKSAWESKGHKESEDVRVAHSSDSSAGNLNPHTESKIQGIRERGEHENLKRMASSTDPKDVEYARKKGYSLD